jgi:hypothetical protein
VDLITGKGEKLYIDLLKNLVIYTHGNGYQKLQDWVLPVAKRSIIIYLTHVPFKKFYIIMLNQHHRVLAGILQGGTHHLYVK